MNKVFGCFLMVIGVIGLAGTLIFAYAVLFGMGFCGTAPNGCAQAWDQARPILGVTFLLGAISSLLVKIGKDALSER